jgi:hypothetical protein
MRTSGRKRGCFVRQKWRPIPPSASNNLGPVVVKFDPLGVRLTVMNVDDLK